MSLSTPGGDSSYTTAVMRLSRSRTRLPSVSLAVLSVCGCAALFGMEDATCSDCTTTAIEPELEAAGTANTAEASSPTSDAGSDAAPP